VLSVDECIPEARHGGLHPTFDYPRTAAGIWPGGGRASPGIHRRLGPMPVRTDRSRVAHHHASLVEDLLVAETNLLRSIRPKHATPAERTCSASPVVSRCADGSDKFKLRLASRFERSDAVSALRLPPKAVATVSGPTVRHPEIVTRLLRTSFGVVRRAVNGAGFQRRVRSGDVDRILLDLPTKRMSFPL
jgi:hypothetical protein